MRALDLFCGGGGAALGLQQAGYEVFGVDINPRHGKVYPGHFIHGDALNPPFDLADFDLIWSSPPCQRFSSSTPSTRRGSHPDLIPATRLLLDGYPRTVIENVPQAPIRPDVILNGPTVGLPEILRVRHFELSWWPGLLPPVMKRDRSIPLVSVVGHGTPSGVRAIRKRMGLHPNTSVADKRRAMGITTPMPRGALSEAVPPAYARFIGELAQQVV